MKNRPEKPKRPLWINSAGLGVEPLDGISGGSRLHPRFLANCVVYYNVSILSEFLERAERENNAELADRIKRVSPVAWKHVNFYGEYTFRNTENVIDFARIIDIAYSLCKIDPLGV